MGTEYSLRSVKRGACNLCDKHRVKTAAQKASSRAWYAKNREHVKAKAKANKQLRVATGQWEAYRLQNKVRHAAYNRQWRRNKGVDTRADYLEKRRLARALRRSTYMSVAALVAQQYAIYTKEHCNKDEEAMRKAAQHLLGEHDFSSFRASSCQALSPIKTMMRVDIHRHGPYWRFEFEGNAFLHHMIRNIMGCMVTIGQGFQAPEWMAAVIASKSRDAAAPTFSPDGLYFQGPVYDPQWGLPTSTPPFHWLP